MGHLFLDQFSEITVTIFLKKQKHLLLVLLFKAESCSKGILAHSEASLKISSILGKICDVSFRCVSGSDQCI